MSDTNILSSFAAGGAFPLLLRLFERAEFGIPPSVRQELLAGLERGNSYLDEVIQSINAGLVVEFTLSSDEQQRVPSYPHKLNLGEREALALAEVRRATLLSNDKRAVAYCQQQQMRVINLVNMLRLLWTRQLVSQNGVRAIIIQMQVIEDLILTPVQQAAVFAPVQRR